MGKWGHRLDLGCVTVIQKVAILPRTQGLALTPLRPSKVCEGQSPTMFSHHPHQTDRKKYPTVACNSLLARAIAKMAAKTDKA